MLLRSQDNLYSEIGNFISDANSLLIICPFIKKHPLSLLFSSMKSNTKICVITRWKPIEILLGVSDTDIFNLCNANNCSLMLNNNIHLKAYIKNEMTSCLITTANISNRGLALGEYYNYEAGTILSSLSVKDQLYFDKIILESTLVDQSVYDSVIKQISKLKIEHDLPERFKLKENKLREKFLLSELPMSNTVDELFRYYNDNSGEGKNRDIRAAVHDANLYGLGPGLKKLEFNSVLKNAFFIHPFIVELMLYNGVGKQFGELTKWLHSRCADVPSPRRYNVKKALKRIFSFVIELSESEYEIYQPGRKSQILKRIN